MRFVLAVLRPFTYWTCRLLFRIKIYGAENIPPEGACIITPNHVTYADPIWITIPIYRRVFYMAWDKPFEIPVLGALMRTFGAFPVSLESADASAQRNAIEVVEKGGALVIFPEGGRSRNGKLMPFKMGAFRLALTKGLPVVPVSIKGADKIWPVGRMLPRPGRLTLTYHPPIEVVRVPEGTSRVELKELARELARRTHDVVATALDPSNLPDDAAEPSLPVETNA